MTNSEMLKDAISIAVHNHYGQVDKAGAPYILHPLRVSNMCKDEKEKIVAILHDVVEDTDITLQFLECKGFTKEIIEAIDSVTRRNEESYSDFIKRCSNNKIGRKVKIADLKDNMDLSRLRAVSIHDIERTRKYERAIDYLK